RGAAHQRGPRRGARPLRPHRRHVRGPHHRRRGPGRCRRHRARPPAGPQPPHGGGVVIRLERRVETPRGLGVVVPFASLAAALLIGAVFLLIPGHDPVDTYDRILDRSLLSDGALSATLTAASPLLFTGLAAAL